MGGSTSGSTLFSLDARVAVKVYWNMPIRYLGWSAWFNFPFFVQPLRWLKPNFNGALYDEKNFDCHAKAKETYKDGLKVLKKVSSVAGMPCKEIKNKIKWGDENYYALRLKDGNPVGFIFSGRLKNKVYTIIMAGLYSSDHGLLTDVIIPKLQSIDRFQIKEIKRWWLNYRDEWISNTLYFIIKQK